MPYLARRLEFFVITLWAALTINFVLPRLMPGNPAVAMMARFHGRVNPQVIRTLEIALGVNRHSNPLADYVQYLANTFTGNFGRSPTFGFQSVGHVIMQALPWTLGLVGVTTVLAFILGTLVGILGAWHRGGLLDSILPPIFIITSAIPYFWAGLLLILIFAITLGWFPIGLGNTIGTIPDWSWSYILDVMGHSILPAATILVTTIGGWILTMRNNMITTLAEDYVKMARAKGLSSMRIMMNYAARNAFLPNLTGFAMSLGFVISGAILVEYVFSYPGLGWMLLQAVQNEDFPLMQTLFLLITVAVLVTVLAADLVTAWLDPRTRDRS